MKKSFVNYQLSIIAVFAMLCSSCQQKQDWQLVWEDNFDAPELKPVEAGTPSCSTMLRRT